MGVSSGDARAHFILQAALVSVELIRTSILWHEMWHSALEEASRMYFGAQDVEGMLQTLGKKAMPSYTTQPWLSYPSELEKSRLPN